MWLPLYMKLHILTTDIFNDNVFPTNKHIQKYYRVLALVNTRMHK